MCEVNIPVTGVWIEREPQFPLSESKIMSKLSPLELDLEYLDLEVDYDINFLPHGKVYPKVLCAIICVVYVGCRGMCGWH